MARGFYSVVSKAQTVSTAITILEITAASTNTLKIIRAWVNQSSITTSAQVNIQLLRKSGTVTSAASAPSALALDASASSGVTVKWKATAEGTDGNVLIDEGFNVLNGWLYLPVPEERIIVPPSGIIALKFIAAPTSATYNWGMVWEEIG